MHPVGHPRSVGVPGHQVGHLRALAQQVLTHQARPDQVVRPQQLKRTGHLLAVEKALVPHDDLRRKGDLALVDEAASARPASVKSVCAASKVSVFSAARRPSRAKARRGDREQRAAEAVTEGMDLAVGHDRVDRIECAPSTPSPVVVHSEVAIVRRRVAATRS